MRLPPFNFIIGPSGCGKTTLQNLLCEADTHMAPCGFDEPVRETVMTVFYADQPMGLHVDLREEEVERQTLPCTSLKIGEFMNTFRDLLRSISPTLLGDLAKKRVANVIGPGFQRVVFDDTTLPDDVRPFALAFGSTSCLLIFVERAGFPTAAYLRQFDNLLLPKLIVKNVEGDAPKMLEHMAQMLPTHAAEAPC